MTLKKIFILLLLSLSLSSFGQNNVAYFDVETFVGLNKIVWYNNVDTINNIEILCADTKTKFYIPLFQKNDLALGKFEFLDTAKREGIVHYRINISFSNAATKYTHVVNLEMTKELIDQSQKNKVINGDVLLSINGNKVIDYSNPENFTDFYYEPSAKIFTNPYSGHINILLDDAQKKRYSITFYDPQKKAVLEVPKIKHTYIVLDAKNFNGKGIYSFKLFDNNIEVEKGYITIY